MRDSLTLNHRKLLQPIELVQPDIPLENPLNSSLPTAEVFPFALDE